MDTNHWEPDGLLPGFEQRFIQLPDRSDPALRATLVRLPAAPSQRVALYIHGFSDYFFQRHLSEQYAARGYAFYAIDLRRYGRSLLAGQPPCFCHDLREYFTEIDAAIAIIEREHPGARLLLSGHSTGGLLATLYGAEGQRRAAVHAIHLNSPFFGFYATPPQQRQIAIVAAIGRIAPRLPVDTGGLPVYGQSLHQSERGEWEFDVRLKPIAGFAPYAGWIRAIAAAHRRVHAGLGIAQPVSLMHSARSIRQSEWGDGYFAADAVLDVEHMRRHGPGIGANVTLFEIDGGMHDLALSPAPARARYFDALFGWAGGAL